MKRIAILIMANVWDPAYSVASVVSSQIRVLNKHGYQIRVLMQRPGKPGPLADLVDYRDCLVPARFDPMKGIEGTRFESEAAELTEKITENLEGIDLAISHDALFSFEYLQFNVAIREAARRLPNIRWLHWTHSSPKERPFGHLPYPLNLCFENMPNSKFLCVTEAHLPRLRKQYALPPEGARVVYNSHASLEFMQLGPLSQKIAEQHRLLTVDIATLVPIILSRTGKQPEASLFLMESLKAQGRTVRLIFANAWGVKLGYSEDLRILELKWLAAKLGLTSEEVVFTSECDPELRNGCPQSVISDLFGTTNLFIHPSCSETCSMTLVEAAMRKNLCVLNSRVPSFKEMAGDNAIWMDFEGIEEEISKRQANPSGGRPSTSLLEYYERKKKYYRKCARQIVKALDAQKNLSLFRSINKRFNESTIFDTQFRPLLEDRTNWS